jgi:hypothetical protein
MVTTEPHHRNTITRNQVAELLQEDGKRILEVICQADAVDQL